MKKVKRILAMMLVFCMMVSVVPVDALAEEESPANVSQEGETTESTTETTDGAGTVAVPIDEEGASGTEKNVLVVNNSELTPIEVGGETSVAVDSVTLDKEAVTISEGNKDTLTATVAPENATDKTVVWTSDNDGVATVDKSGVVTAVSVGTATITAEAEGKSSTCNVTVVAASTEKYSYGGNEYDVEYTEGVDSENVVAYVISEKATGYDSLADAIAQGGTVVLVNNVNVKDHIDIQTSVNLDLNGYMITTDYAGRAFWIIEDGVVVTVNGTTTGSGMTTSVDASETVYHTKAYGSFDIKAQNVTLTINGGNYSQNTNWGGIFRVRDFSGVTVNLNDVTAYTNCQVVASAGAIILNVHGGKFSGGVRANRSYYNAFYLPYSISTFDGATLSVVEGYANAGTGFIEVAGGTAVFSDCKIQAPGDESSIWDAPIQISCGAKVTINSGTYEGQHAVYVMNSGGSLFINGGTYTGAKAAIKADTSTTSTVSTVNVTDGIFTGELAISSGSKLNITGGTFSVDPTNYVAKGYEAVKDSPDAYWTVQPGNYVAQIDDNYYKTLQEAIDAAGTSTTAVTITMLADTTENVTVAEGQNITLNLGNYTLNGGSVESNGTKAAITNYGALTVNGKNSSNKGTIKREDDDTGLTASNSYYVIDNQGTMTLKYVNVSNNSGVNNGHEGSSLIRVGEINPSASLTVSYATLTQPNFNVIKSSGTTTINEYTVIGSENSQLNYAVLSYGEFIMNKSTASVYGPVCIRGYKNATENIHGVATIKYGTIIGNITVEQYPEHASTEKPSLTVSGSAKIDGTIQTGVGNGTTFEEDTVPNTNGSVTLSGGYYTVKPDNAFVEEGKTFVYSSTTGYPYSIGSAVVRIGDVKYSVISTAVKNANEGDTIVLLKDYNASVTINRKVVFDLDQHTISTSKGNLSNLTVKGGATIQNGTISMGRTMLVGAGSSGEIFKNITFVTKDEFPDSTMLQIDASNTIVEFNNCRFNSEKAVNGFISNKNLDKVTVTLDNTSITTAGDIAFSVNGTCTNVNTSLNNCTLSGAKYGIYYPASGTLTVNGGSITGTVTGIENRGANMTITGNAVVTGGTGELTYEPNGGGTTTCNAAVAVVPYSGRNMTIAIENGSFSGTVGYYFNNDNNATVNEKAIKGGYFTTSPAEKYLVDGYGVFANEGTDKGTYKYYVTKAHVVEVTSELQDIKGGKVSESSIAAISGGGKVAEGDVTLTARLLSQGAVTNLQFEGWYAESDRGNRLSSSATWTTNIINDESYVAVYRVTETANANLTLVNNNEGHEENKGIYTVSYKDGTNDKNEVSSESFTTSTGISEVTVTYEQEGKQTVYWLNSSGHVVSTNPKFTTTIVGDVTLTAVTVNNNSGEKHVLVRFISSYDQIISNQSYQIGSKSNLTLPAIPSCVGYEGKAWIFNGTEYKVGQESEFIEAIETVGVSSNDGQILDVRPVYERMEDNNKATISVYLDNEVVRTKEMTLGDGLVLDIQNYEIPEGKKFAGWKVGEKVVSYSDTYIFVPTQAQSYTIEILFSDSVEKQVTTNVTETKATQNTPKNLFEIVAVYDVPKEYTFVETGVYYSSSRENLNNNKTHYVSNVSTPSGTIKVNVNAKVTKLYVKSYVTYIGTDGQVNTIYSDPVIISVQ